MSNTESNVRSKEDGSIVREIWSEGRERGVPRWKLVLYMPILLLFAYYGWRMGKDIKRTLPTEE